MDATEKPTTGTQVAEVLPGTARFDGVLELASRVLAQDRDLTSAFPAAQESHFLGPVTSVENYALKLAAGYVLDPSRDNDSYYFLVRL